MLTEKLSASRRDLQRAKLGTTETLRPIWDKGAMRRTGHRVFWNARARREESGDEIAVITGRCGDDSQTIETHERGHVRLQASDSLLGLEDGEVVASFCDGCRTGTKRIAQLSRRLAGRAGACREI